MSTGPTIESTYRPWLLSLFLETILYGVGALQTGYYFRWYPKDHWSIKFFVLLVLFFETTQITFFYRSTDFRFVERFGVPQGDLIWSDSLQLLANYLSQFTVQIYFASRIFRLTRERGKVYKTSAVGVYVVAFLAFIQISAGIAQTVWTYKLRSYSKLNKTKPITTLQTVASLACDIGITVYLCVFLKGNKNGLPKTESMMNSLMINAINRGMLTAVSSALTTALFLASPDTFWFFIPLAPSSKLYMNSMLATLNMRQHFRDKYLSNDRDLHTIQMGSIHTAVQKDSAMSAVEFVKPASVTADDEDDDGSPKTAEFPSCGSVES
ncbi:hypothetical protein B0H17DRAFT_1137662 [Mycena rosella]|uniref:DUF6534 domain-containing protein n=1 Tax=Mycena rosella TaxID=1033263 RepID=A0AAD7GF82_MYCRO|nr:hypothetical protein B0H17DRAFT_1137662 [Mycena rosella]